MQDMNGRRRREEEQTRAVYLLTQWPPREQLHNKSTCDKTASPWRGGGGPLVLSTSTVGVHDVTHLRVTGSLCSLGKSFPHYCPSSHPLQLTHSEKDKPHPGCGALPQIG